MEMKEMLARIAAIISTLDETNGSPESMLYIFLDMNMDLWMRVRNVLIQENLIQIKSNYVTLTAKGKEAAGRINSAIKH